MVGLGDHTREMEHVEAKVVVHVATAVVAWSDRNGTPPAVHGRRGYA
jgi:hypothetical protein